MLRKEIYKREMKREKPVLVVSAFIKKGGKYFVVNSTKLGFWRVPGGRVDFGEKVEDTLKREMKEELNVDVKINKFLGYGQDYVEVLSINKKIYRFIVYFECEIIGGEFRLIPEEATEYKWLTISEIKRLKPLEPGMKELFEKFKIK